MSGEAPSDGWSYTRRHLHSESFLQQLHLACLDVLRATIMLGKTPLLLAAWFDRALRWNANKAESETYIHA